MTEHEYNGGKKAAYHDVPAEDAYGHAQAIKIYGPTTERHDCPLRDESGQPADSQWWLCRCRSPIQTLH